MYSSINTTAEYTTTIYMYGNVETFFHIHTNIQNVFKFPDGVLGINK